MKSTKLLKMICLIISLAMVFSVSALAATDETPDVGIVPLAFIKTVEVYVTSSETEFISDTNWWQETNVVVAFQSTDNLQSIRLKIDIKPDGEDWQTLSSGDFLSLGGAKPYTLPAKGCKFKIYAYTDASVHKGNVKLSVSLS